MTEEEKQTAIRNVQCIFWTKCDCSNTCRHAKVHEEETWCKEKEGHGCGYEFEGKTGRTSCEEVKEEV